MVEKEVQNQIIMEQNLNEKKSVEEKKFSTDWYEKQNSASKDGKELNGFTSGVLWMCAVYQIFRSAMTVMTGGITMGLDANTGILQIIGGVLSVLIAIAIILIVNKNKFGIYAFFALEITHVVIGGILGGETAYSFGTYVGVALFQIVVISVLLCLKKNGKSGWNTILG